MVDRPMISVYKYHNVFLHSLGSIHYLLTKYERSQLLAFYDKII